MTRPAPDQITRHLRELQDGDASAVERLLPGVYQELRALAERAFRDQAQHHTLQPTVLVHDAYLRLVGGAGGAFSDRKHFYRVAAIAMRQLLVDYARARGAAKRGGRQNRVMLEEVEPRSDGLAGIDLVALDEALTELAELDERLVRVVELRFLAGLTVDEVAEALEVSPRTVALDWKMARSWLRRRLGGDEEDAGESEDG